MLPLLYTLLCAQMHHMFADLPFYPEIDATLQCYQDLSTCSLDKTEWSLVYRNFHDDVYFGSIKCIRFRDLRLDADYASPNLSLSGNFTTTHVIILDSSWNYTAKNLIITDTNELHSIVEVHVIFRDCELCMVLRHPYANNGFGCTYWRSFNRIRQQAEGCEFIYDELCGTTPKYDLYDPTCAPVTFSIHSWEPVTPPPPSPPPTTTPTDTPPNEHPGHQNPWDILNPWQQLKPWKQWIPGNPSNKWNPWNQWNQGNQGGQGNQDNQGNQWKPGQLWSPLTDVVEGVTGPLQSVLNPLIGK
ncbi:uncharacterized protein [Dermacentor andersoni]|uniref:uncharacterized protein n=1 Tax=Dermacentor andersoni TaxID=34620 RepID=UPI0024179441|nr:uncharacterized protein LOC129388106 [Dermacentor andersoni]